MSLLRHLLSCFLITGVALSAPVAVDDSYTATEDTILTVGQASQSYISANFETGGTPVNVVGGAWNYLEKIQNQFGTNLTYPVDGTSNNWKSIGFDVSTSTVGPWGSSAMPIQGGGINAVPGAANTLTGMTGGPAGEYLVTTYLFRKTFTLNAAQASVANWTLRYLVDDGAVFYLNGQQIDIYNLNPTLTVPPGALTTNTAAPASGDENNYTSKTVDLTGKLVSGLNVLSVELHQTHGGNYTSSDVGMDVSLTPPTDQAQGFTQVPDAFYGTVRPDKEAFAIAAGTATNTTQAYSMTMGGCLTSDTAARRATSAAIRKVISLPIGGAATLSFKYRLIFTNGYENNEYGEVIAEMNGTKLGTAANPSHAGANVVAYRIGNGNGGADDDTGWVTATYNLNLSAGDHTLLLGGYNNGSSTTDELTYVWFDDVELTAAGVANGLLANDTGGATSAIKLTDPTKGSVTFNADGTFVYTPNADANGTDSFTYKASDGTEESAPATVTINITPVNDAPVAVANSYTLAEDTMLTVNAATGVLSNDTDIDSANLTAVVRTQPTSGALTMNANGSFIYTPVADFFGTVTFTYRVSDGALNSNTVTVTLNVTPVNETPVTGPAESFSLPKNTTFTITNVNGTNVTENLILGTVRTAGNAITTPGSLWRYSDVGPLAGVAVADWKKLSFDDAAWKEGPSELGYGDGPSVPEVTVIEDNSVPGYVGSDTDRYWTAYFRKKVSIPRVNEVTSVSMQVLRDDGSAIYLNENEIYRSDLITNPSYNTPAAVGVTGADENTFFDASNIGQGTNQNWTGVAPNPTQLVEGDNIFAAEIHQNTQGSTDVSFDLKFSITRQTSPGLLFNDSDPDGDPITARLVTQAAHGTVTINPNGTFSYTPNLAYVGTDTFSYDVYDGISASAPVTVTLTVTQGGNVAPIANADSYDATEDTALTVNAAAGVLANDVEPDGDPFTAVLVTQPTKGTLILNANGSFTYTPIANLNGTDTFTYKATDGSDSPPATVTINLTPVNDLPVAVNDVYGADPGQSLVINAALGVLANDTDVDGNTLNAVVVSQPSSGTLVLNANGSFSYTSAAAGIYTFTYRANDGTGDSNLAIVTLAINAAPVGVAETYTTFEDVPLTVPAATGVLANDSDPENQTLTAILISPPAAGGSLTLNANGSFSYTPPINRDQPVTFIYQASDGFRTSPNITVTIHLTPVNDAPTVVGNTYTALVNQSLTITAPGLLANDSDVEGNSILAVIETQPAHGTVALNADGSFLYTPAVDYVGPDSFTYRAFDGVDISSPATVSINVASGSAVVINEIMARPGTTYPELTNREWIEIYNRGTTQANLSNWKIDSGVDFIFPANITVPAGGYLVVAANLAAFQAANPTVANVIGGWIGTLSNSSNTLNLVDADGNNIDTVTYATEGDWAQRIRETVFNGWEWSNATNGGGKTLELRNPQLSNDNGQNWQASTPTNGTPGVVNSRYTTNVPPIIKAMKHSPAVPKPTDSVLISCELNDELPNQALTATLHWRDATTTTPGAFTEVPMSTDGNEKWFAPIPPQVNLAIIEFYVSASDGTNTRTWPAPTSEGQNANCQYQVDSLTDSTVAQTQRLILTGEENAAYAALAPQDSASNKLDREFNSTLIVTRGQESEIHYLATIRFRGNSSRSYTFKPLRLSLPSDQSQHGLGGYNLNPKASFTQYFGNRLLQASGLASPDCIPVDLRRNGVRYTTNGGNVPDFGLWVMVEDFNGGFIENHFPNADQGGIYKKGRPDEFWKTFNAPANPASVPDGWIKQSGSAANNWSDITNFMQTWQANVAPHFTGGNAGDANGGTWNGTAFTPTQYAAVETVGNLDQWARWFAVMTILQSNETNISNGQDDDYAVYFASDIWNGQPAFRMNLLAHDLDTIFGLGDSQLAYNGRGLYDSTDDGSIFSTLLPLMGNNATAGNTTFRTKYFNALRELIGTVFNADTTADPNPPFYRLVDQHLSNWVPVATRTVIKDFIRQRGPYLLGLMGEAATTPPAATSTATLTAAHGTLCIHEILANNISAHANGSTFPDVIELRNTSASTVNLDGMSITDDPLLKTKFIFPVGTSIPANGMLVLYADSATTQPGIHLGFGLDSDGDTVALYQTLANGQGLIDSISFGLQPADYSIGRTGASLDTWALCTPSVGFDNATVPTLGPPSGLRINEWLGNADYRAADDFIEIHNSAANPVALSGMHLTDDFINYPARGTIAPLSYIGPNGFIAFLTKGSSASPGNARELDYKLGSTFGNIALLGVNLSQVDEVSTVAHFRDRSVGRLPDSGPAISNLSLPSPGFTNAPLDANQVNLINFLRITEVMYNPSNSSRSEYIELRNMSDKSATPVGLELAGVTFSKGISYVFPAMTLAPGAHVVIAGDAAKFTAQFPSIPVLGAWSVLSKLSNSDDRVRLDIPNGGVAILDFHYYDDWYPATDGQGSALQIVDGTAAPAQWDKQVGWQATAPNPGSSPPFSISAGIDIYGNLATPILLDGAIQPGATAPQDISVLWTKESGPGTVTFTTADYQDANGRFSAPGVYVLKFTATVGATTTSDTVQVTIAEDYNAWVARMLSGQAPANQAQGADPDQDGISNLIEYATGSNPLAANSVLTPTWINEHLGVRYPISATLPQDIQVITQISYDLQTWFDNVTNNTMESATSSLQQWLSEDLNAPAPEGRTYFRIKVICP
jgi:VCBS repeat-containing protein